MNGSTDRLIEALAADARPVRRLAPPTRRAVLWLLGLAVAAAAGVLLFADTGAAFRRTDSLFQWLSVLGELGTGVAAVIAACHLALPDRSSRWAWAPVPFVVLWLAASGYGCLAVFPSLGPVGPVPEESRGCFLFMVGISLPVGAGLFLMLRRARPMREKLTAVVGAIGVAAIAALLLRFFHPFEITVMDLAFHLAAVGLVIAAGALASRRVLAGEA